MRARVLASGSLPNPAPMLSSRCCGLFVAGMTQVTAGCDTIHFNRNCAQEWQSNSAAQAGSGFWGNNLKYAATAERTIDNDTHAKFLGEWQDTRGRRSIHQRIINLHEIRLLGRRMILSTSP